MTGRAIQERERLVANSHVPTDFVSLSWAESPLESLQETWQMKK